ncbi:MAG: hypothetical protein ACTHU0_09925 [Kofleriaceae bacterium]
MTKLSGSAVLVLSVAACGGSKVNDVKITDEHVAAVNAAVPADLKDKLSFEAGEIKVERGRRTISYKLAIPKGWKKGFMEGELKPADADNFGSKTLGRSELQVGSNCDGACKKKDWAAVSDKVHFSQFTSGKMEGKVLKDEKGPHRRTLVFEAKTSESFPEHSVAVYVMTAWWDPDDSRYYTCQAELGAQIKGAADAFEKACSLVGGGGD